MDVRYDGAGRQRRAASSDGRGGLMALDRIVQIDSGLLAGGASSDGAVRIFKGIPFGKPPVAELRWRPPQPLEPWQGVRLGHVVRPAVRASAAPKNVARVFSAGTGERGLSLPQCVGPSGCAGRPGHGLDSRRRLQHGLRIVAAVQWRSPGPQGRGARDVQLPARPIGVPRASGIDR